MSNFSLSWFKRQAELESLMIEEQRLKNEILRKELPNSVAGSDFDMDAIKPYLNVKLVNDVLTVVLNDGSIVSKPNATTDDFNAVRNASSEVTILGLVGSTEIKAENAKREEEANRMKAIIKGLAIISGLNDFEVEGNSVKLAGTGRTLPQLLVEKFIEIVHIEKYYAGFGDLESRLAQNDEYQGLKRFFMWCCLNPRAEVADKLYDFLNTNGFRITKQGFFIALRNVVTLHGGSDLVTFVSNVYNKVKAVWKKDTNEYTVFLQDGEYKIVHSDDIYDHTMLECGDCDGEGTIDMNDEWYDEELCETCDGLGEYEDMSEIDHGQKIGGLTELYLDLPNRHENRFTDNWSRTFDIRIGQPVSMPSEDCNWSTQDCATAGLHFAGYTAPYVLCGDTTVFTLHNPMKVVGIGTEKGRCWEYLPFMLTTVAEADEIMNDGAFDFLQLDEQYAIRELENLAEKVVEGFSIEAKKYEFSMPAITSQNIEFITLSLNDMKSSIADRVSYLD
jgi:hypothetical protein